MNHYHVKSLPGHRKANSSGCVYIHILKAEKALGRPLPPKAEVHHVDENKLNNENSNLVICQDKAYHKLLHVRARLIRLGCKPGKEFICCWCKKVLPLSEFSPNARNKSYGVQRACRECMREYSIKRHRANKMAGA